MIEDIKMIDTWKQTRYKAEQLISHRVATIRYRSHNSYLDTCEDCLKGERK